VTLDAERQKWVEEHSGLIVPSRLAQQFHDHLLTLPWLRAGTRLDWSGVPSLEVDLETPPFPSLEATRLGRHDHVFVMLNLDEQGIVCATELLLENFDLLYAGAMGVEYVCGAELRGGDADLFMNDYAEYDGRHTIRVRLP
jgi:hypothetical protein